MAAGPTETTAFELVLTRAKGDAVTTVTIECDGPDSDGGFDVCRLLQGHARAAGYNVETYHRTTRRGRATLYA